MIFFYGIMYGVVRAMKITKQKGTRDIFLEDAKIWEYMEENIRNICEKYNVSEIRTPVFEATELYARGVGDDTDIVNKEMYTFLDKGGRSITLRPELTAGVVRSYIENGMSSLTSPLKFWYTANMYRYEKMQKGRFREFAQFGVEIFGSESYLADVETMLISYEFFKNIGLLDKLVLSINSIGCKECRKKYLEILKDYIRPNLDNMCDDCKRRFEKNPMRLLDCKEEKCKAILKDAPIITDYLCDDCKKDFESVKKALETLKIEYKVDTSIVRGLDYYNKTVYEWTSKDLGLACGGGGRYDSLVEVLGGSYTPAVGFGIGMDRIFMLLKESDLVSDKFKNVDFYIATLDESVDKRVYDLINSLRDKGYIVDNNITSRNFKNQLKYADKVKARYVIIIGEDELNKNVCQIKDMEKGTQKECELNIDSVLNSL